MGTVRTELGDILSIRGFSKQLPSSGELLSPSAGVWEEEIGRTAFENRHNLKAPASIAWRERGEEQADVIDLTTSIREGHGIFIAKDDLRYYNYPKDNPATVTPSLRKESMPPKEWEPSRQD